MNSQQSRDLMLFGLQTRPGVFEDAFRNLGYEVVAVGVRAERASGDCRRNLL